MLSLISDIVETIKETWRLEFMILELEDLKVGKC